MQEGRQQPTESTGKEPPEGPVALIEAALYVAGRPLDLERLGSVARVRSRKRVQKLARELAEGYGKRDTALEVLELEDGRFVMQLKAQYTPRVQRLAIRPLLTRGPLTTLSYVAYRQPVLQKQVADIRGRHAYGHLRQLEDLGLITRERAGRTSILRTTDFFADFFGLSRNPRTAKRQLQRYFEVAGLELKEKSLET